MSEFLAMGGYAQYVWGSFAAALAVFAWNLLAVRLQRRELQRRIKSATGTGE